LAFLVVEGVTGGDRDRERGAGRGRGRSGGVEVVEPGRGHRDVGRAGLRGQHGVVDRDRLGAGGREGDAVREGVRAVVTGNERVVRRQGRPGPATGEVHGAGVAGDLVVEGVTGGDRDRERGAGRRSEERGVGKEGGPGWGPRDVGRAGLRGQHGVFDRDRLGAGGREGDSVREVARAVVTGNERVVRRQGRPGPATGEVHGAGVAGDLVVEGVTGGDRDRERGAGRRSEERGVGKEGGPGWGPRDVGRAGLRGQHGVFDRDRLGAGGREGDSVREVARAVVTGNERVVRRQGRPGPATGEVHGAGVAGDLVVEGVTGGDRDRERGAGRRSEERGVGKEGGPGWGPRDVGRAGLRGQHGVFDRDRLGAGGREGDSVREVARAVVTGNERVVRRQGRPGPATGEVHGAGVAGDLVVEGVTGGDRDRERGAGRRSEERGVGKEGGPGWGPRDVGRAGLRGQHGVFDRDRLGAGGREGDSVREVARAVVTGNERVVRRQGRPGPATGEVHGAGVAGDLVVEGVTGGDRDRERGAGRRSEERGVGKEGGPGWGPRDVGRAGLRGQHGVFDRDRLGAGGREGDSVREVARAVVTGNERVVRRQGRPGPATGEVHGAGVAGDLVVEGVTGGDRDRERGAGRRSEERGVGKEGGPGWGPRDVGRAGLRGQHGVFDRDRLGAGGREGDSVREVARAVVTGNERVVRRQGRPGPATGEVHGAGVAGDLVVEGVTGGDRDRERGAGRGREIGRAAGRDGLGRGQRDVGRAGLRGQHGVVDRERLGAGGRASGVVRERVRAVSTGNERVVRRQGRPGPATGEVHGAGVAGDLVVEGVTGGDRDRERGAGRGR